VTYLVELDQFQELGLVGLFGGFLDIVLQEVDQRNLGLVALLRMILNVAALIPLPHLLILTHPPTGLLQPPLFQDYLVRRVSPSELGRVLRAEIRRARDGVW
jgi:hypothetical protein